MKWHREFKTRLAGRIRQVMPGSTISCGIFNPLAASRWSLPGRNSDPKFTFWLGVFVTIAVAVGNGSVHLTDMVPVEWVKPITAWNSFLGFVGTALMTALTGMSSAKSGPLTGGK